MRGRGRRGAREQAGAGGSVHMLRPRVHPLFHPGVAAAVKLTAGGRGPNASAPHLRTQLGHAAVPPPGGNPALLLVRAEVPTGGH